MEKENAPEPACINADDENLDEGFYCKICGIAWYNCICCQRED